jgi:hypothetical protein
MQALLVAAVAAHVGGVPTQARFVDPEGVGNTANNAAIVTWMDGDLDPTGLFDFFYQPSNVPPLAGLVQQAPVEQHEIFPTMVSHMISVGEETGQLENMLAKIADFYEAEVDAKVKALTSLIEPLMIVFVGGGVGFIVISMYLPIFSLYDAIR